MILTETKLTKGRFARLATACLLFFTPAVNAATNYVDSVHSWGAWELGIEPAAGPQTPQGNNVNNRSLNLQFRPNDNAAYMTSGIKIPPPLPPTPPAPPVFSSGFTDRPNLNPGKPSRSR